MDVLEEVKLEGYREGREEGREEGLFLGIEKEKFFSCRNMLHLGFEQGTIAGILEVSPGYVLQVQEQLSKEKEVEQSLKAGKKDDSSIAGSLGVSLFLVEAVRKKMDMR